MPVSITGIDPEVVSREGGSLLTLTGTFPTDQVYTVTVGGIAAYAGSGAGGSITSADGVTIQCVVPLIAVSSVGSVTVEATSSPGAESDTIALTVLERFFSSAGFGMRRNFPPQWAVGPRRLDSEPQEK